MEIQNSGNYELGIVYKIYYNEIIYIGSTLGSLNDRWQNHISGYRRWLEGKGPNISIYKYFFKCNINKFKIEAIKYYWVLDKAHLLTREQLYINKVKCINKNNPFNIINKINKSIYNNEWYIQNKDKVKEYNKEYYKKHKRNKN